MTKLFAGGHFASHADAARKMGLKDSQMLDKFLAKKGIWEGKTLGVWTVIEAYLKDLAEQEEVAAPAGGAARQPSAPLTRARGARSSWPRWRSCGMSRRMMAKCT